jgi:hypothetical protein
MQELNGFSQEFRIYTDDRSYQASFTTPVNKVVFLNNNQNSFALPTGSDIIAQRSISSASTFTVGLGATGNVTWVNPLPTDVTSSVPSAGNYRVTGPLVKPNYDIVKAPTINFPVDYKTRTRITANLNLGSSGTAWSTDVVWPLSGTANAWSYANSTASTANGSDSLVVSMSVLGSNLDTYLSNVTVSTGNITNNTAVTVTPTTNGNIDIGLTGNVILPNDGTGSFISSIPTTVTLNTTSGQVLSYSNIPLKVNVDGIYNNQYSGQPGIGATMIVNEHILNHISSGVTNKFPTTVTATYPNVGPYTVEVWATTNKPTTRAQFDAYTPVTGALTATNQRASIGRVTSPGVFESTNIRVDQLLTNWATITWPSQPIQQLLYLVIIYGQGNPKPVTQDIQITATKTNVQGGALRTQNWSLRT